ncbi:hypothetical protein PTRA_a1168 [Pseudoalteromonas translucida KMM 520]|uniref:Uncharacterized protein n=1 Tax=Pseudoalteromonas translucida KMM 520 TaxID=1315283 RepID=A0A0U2MNK9_9GAMM|nr:hypothetical protein PTRA_a1168 [Pseudoalteromonas translucida KMM 520]
MNLEFRTKEGEQGAKVSCGSVINVGQINTALIIKTPQCL